jgi:hypothetical protein
MQRFAVVFGGILQRSHARVQLGDLALELQRMHGAFELADYLGLVVGGRFIAPGGPRIELSVGCCAHRPYDLPINIL